MPIALYPTSEYSLSTLTSHTHICLEFVLERGTAFNVVVFFLMKHTSLFIQITISKAAEAFSSYAVLCVFFHYAAVCR